MQMLAVRGQ